MKRWTDKLNGTVVKDIAYGFSTTNFIFEIEGKLIGFRIPTNMIERVEYTKYNKPRPNDGGKKE